MAIALDRVTEAIAERTDPAKRHLDAAGRRRARLAHRRRARRRRGRRDRSATCSRAGSAYSRWTAQDWLLARVQSVLDYVQKPTTFLFNDITNPVGTFLVAHLLQPLDTFLVETPWFVTLAGLTAIAFVLSGLPPRGDDGADVRADRRDRRVARRDGHVLAGARRDRDRGRDRRRARRARGGESTWVSRVVRPINDVLQTLPQLVYVIPFVYVFPISYVPGLIASVLYAFPVVVRLVERGVRDVAPPAVEAAGAFGATRLQILVKVKIPLARDAIMLGVNQGIIMVLAVVVIAGLVGSGALGYAVAAGPAARPVRHRRRCVDRDPRHGHRARPGDKRQSKRRQGRSRVERTSGSTERIGAVAALVAIGVLVVASTATARPTAAKASCGTVTLNEQAWTGSTANTYVAKYVLEKYLGCKVKVTDIAEIPVYQAMAQGKVDAVLEDWQHVAQYKQYATKQKTVTLEGSNGLTGHIGWFIPKYLLKKYPSFATWKGIKGHEKVFASPEAPGDVPRRRPVVRAEGHAADPGARPEPEARDRRRRDRRGGALQPADRAEEAGDLLLVDAASTGTRSSTSSR